MQRFIKMFSVEVIQKTKETREDKFEFRHCLVDMGMNDFISNVYRSFNCRSLIMR